MNIAQLSEQLKDVPQAKLIDYAKNPNSVVPQFLALAEIQRRQTLMRSMPAQAPQSSVAEDIMAQESPRMSGVAQLPTRAMFTEEGMAGGGIVAFADGGDLDADDLEDYLENIDQSQALSVSQRLRNMLSEMPMSYERARATTPVTAPPKGEAKTASFANPLARIESMPSRKAIADEGIASLETKKGSHKYEDMVIAEAKRQGLDPTLARHVLYKETGNIANPENVRSKAGAIGVMQLMPSTAKELGVDPTNPEENIRGGITYLRKMMDKYNDPVLAAAAYNAGPGRLDRALKGEGLTSLPRETRMYIAGLADGGSVKSYRVGGDTDEEDPEAVRQAYIDAELMRQRKLMEDRGQTDQAAVRKAEPVPLPTMKEKSSQADVRKIDQAMQPIPPEVKPSVTMPRQSSQAEVRAVDNAIIANQQAAQNKAQPPAQTSALPVPTPDQTQFPENRYLSMLEKDLERQIAEAKRTGDQDKYLALMQAGFAMMGGTSPYAAANIGQGAVTGLGAYAASQKGQREAERGILSTRLGLAKAATTAETARQNRELIEMSKRERLTAAQKRENQDVIETAEARFNQDPMVKKIAAQLQDIAPTDPAYGWYQQELERLRNNAYARAKIPGYSMIPNPQPFPEQAKKPGFLQSLFGGGSKPAASSTPVDFSKLPS